MSDWNDWSGSKIDVITRRFWQIPSFTVSFWNGLQHRACVVIPVFNEGKRILTLIEKMNALEIDKIADIIIVDGGSEDGSLDPALLKQKNVIGLLIKREKGQLSAQLRCAYAFVLEKGYEFIVTIDGNDKDDPSAIPKFLELLEQGIDFVQASRFIPGGVSSNTPLLRFLAIRFIHAPLLSLFCGFRWTDTTQGFRGYHRNVLLNPNIAPFRDIFKDYELLAYLSYRIPKCGYRCIETPTHRNYPKNSIPTKIKGVRGHLNLFKVLIKTCLGFYNPL